MNGSKRVCFVRQASYPDELSVRREVETLHGAGFETHVICIGDGNRAREEMVNGVHVHRIPLVRKKTSLARYVYDYASFFSLAALRLTGLHLRRPFDAVQVNTMPDFLVFAALIPKLLGAKVVVMMHEPVPELWRTIHGSLPPQVLTWTEQWALAYVDAALTVTQQLKETYVGRGAEAAKISVILNVPETRFLGLDEDVVEADPEPAGEGVEHFTLISHGAIEERYGHDTMLEAVALVRSQIPGLRLRIMGRGSYQDEFVTLVGRMGLEDCVQYLGWVSLSQMVRELRASDAGIVAQKSSPYSNLVHTNKMYEFIALGKPVLASRLRAVEAYFGEDALCYFEPGDAESLAHGILDLYRHPAKRRTLVENAQALYNQYKWERQKDVYLSVYRALLG